MRPGVAAQVGGVPRQRLEVLGQGVRAVIVVFVATRTVALVPIGYVPIGYVTVILVAVFW